MFANKMTDYKNLPVSICAGFAGKCVHDLHHIKIKHVQVSLYQMSLNQIHLSVLAILLCVATGKLYKTWSMTWLLSSDRKKLY